VPRDRGEVLVDGDDHLRIPYQHLLDRGRIHFHLLEIRPEFIKVDRAFCAKIDEDPDYWADQTMMKLLEAVST